MSFKLLKWKNDMKHRTWSHEHDPTKFALHQFQLQIKRSITHPASDLGLQMKTLRVQHQRLNKEELEELELRARRALIIENHADLIVSELTARGINCQLVKGEIEVDLMHTALKAQIISALAQEITISQN